MPESVGSERKSRSITKRQRTVGIAVCRVPEVFWGVVDQF